MYKNARKHETNIKSSSHRNLKRNDYHGQRSFTDKTTCYPVEALMTNSKKGSIEQQKQGEPTFPCVFCKGSHFNDNCDKCTTLSDRKQQLSLQGRCFICLKVGHLFKNCDSFKKCYYCKGTGHHNRCICPKQFAMSSEVPTGSQSFTTNVDQCSEKDQANNTAATDTSLTVSANIDKPLDDSDQILLASGERVLLQTAVAPVCCSDGSNFA